MESNFNPRPLTGATNFLHWQNSLVKFQSTPPHGGDPLFPVAQVPHVDFNPRPLTGATLASRFM